MPSSHTHPKPHTQLAPQRWGQPKRRAFRYANCSIATNKIRSKMDANGCTASHRICSLRDLPCCGNPPFPESAPATAVRLLQDMPRRANPLFTESAPTATIHPLQNLPPLRRSAHRKNKKSNFFATFLRLRTLLRLRKTKNSRFTTDHLRFCVLICD